MILNENDKNFLITDRRYTYLTNVEFLLNEIGLTYVLPFCESFYHFRFEEAIRRHEND